LYFTTDNDSTFEKEDAMLKTSILGGLLGGLALFVWSAFSWMVLPWHMMTMEKFKDEGTVAQAIAANAPVRGIYLLPNPHKHDPGLSDEKRKTEEAASMKRMVEGPTMFASVSPQGAGSMNMSPMLLVQLLTDIIAAFLATRLLLRTRGLTYGCRVGLVSMVALIIFVSAHVSYWNWWRFPTEYTLVALADLLISWTLAGLIIAKLTDHVVVETVRV
jgi:hypothetical protein